MLINGGVQRQKTRLVMTCDVVVTNPTTIYYIYRRVNAPPQRGECSYAKVGLPLIRQPAACSPLHRPSQFGQSRLLSSLEVLKLVQIYTSELLAERDVIVFTKFKGSRIGNGTKLFQPYLWLRSLTGRIWG